MLFLAVFCGFLAENQREHMIEHQREKKYIRSLYEDLKKDTANMRASVKFRRVACEQIDSVIYLLKNKLKDNINRKIYHLARQIPYSQGPRRGINIKTFDQLKSSGNLRLIRKLEILDMISEYYYDASTMSWALDMSFQHQHDLFLSLHKLFDAAVFEQMIDSNSLFTVREPVMNTPLLTDDPVVINEICSRFHFTKGTHRAIISHFEDLKIKALKLMETLRKEYHLD